MDLMSYALRDPRIPRVDEPELYALALGFILDLPVLTENRGAKRLASLHPSLARLEVLGALEVLERAIIEGLVDVDECASILDEYTIDTRHMFPRKEA